MSDAMSRAMKHAINHAIFMQSVVQSVPQTKRSSKICENRGVDEYARRRNDERADLRDIVRAQLKR